MYLNKVSASTGALWFRRGITLFFKSPLVFLALNLAYLLITMATALIPVVHVFPSFAWRDFPKQWTPRASVPARNAGTVQLCRKCIGFDNLRIAGRRKTHAN